MDDSEFRYNMRHRYVVLLLVFFYNTRVGEALFVPEEIPSLVSFIYNSIPPIAKGTDSRIGLGFRVGPNADFQMVFELGPQKETQPLQTVQGFGGRKRHIPKSLEHYPAPPPRPFFIQHSGTPNGWLSAWKNAVSSKGTNMLRATEKMYNVDSSETRYPGDPRYPTVPRHLDRMNYKTIQHLRKLYREQPA